MVIDTRASSYIYGRTASHFTSQRQSIRIPFPEVPVRSRHLQILVLSQVNCVQSRAGLEGPALGRVEVGRRASEFRPSVDGNPASQVFSLRLGGH